MALPSFLQAMFTPARSGSYQWQNRPDQGGGEFTGEIEGIYEGDAQDLIFKPRAHRGPGNTVGQKMPDATNATTGMGQSATQDMMDAVKATGLGGDYDSEGMSSISEVMQGQAGEMSPMGYASPFGDPTVDELGIGGGSGSALGPGLADMETMSAFDAPMTPSVSMRGKYAEEGPGMLSRAPTTVGDPNFYEDATPMVPTATDSVRPGESMSGGWMDEQIPIQGTRFAPASERMPVLRFLQSLLGGGGEATVPKVAPALFVPPDTLGSTGGQFKNIYEGQTGGDDVMNALQAYLRQRN